MLSDEQQSPFASQGVGSSRHYTVVCRIGSFASSPLFVYQSVFESTIMACKVEVQVLRIQILFCFCCCCLVREKLSQWCRTVYGVEL